MNRQSIPDLRPLKLNKEGFLGALAGFAAIMPNSLLQQWQKSYIENEQFEEAHIIQQELAKERNIPERIYPIF